MTLFSHPTGIFFVLCSSRDPEFLTVPEICRKKNKEGSKKAQGEKRQDSYIEMWMKERRKNGRSAF